MNESSFEVLKLGSFVVMDDIGVNNSVLENINFVFKSFKISSFVDMNIGVNSSVEVFKGSFF